VRVSTCVLHPAAPTRLLRAAALDVVRHHLVEAGRLSMVVQGASLWDALVRPGLVSKGNHLGLQGARVWTKHTNATTMQNHHADITRELHARQPSHVFVCHNTGIHTTQGTMMQARRGYMHKEGGEALTSSFEKGRINTILLR